MMDPMIYCGLKRDIRYSFLNGYTDESKEKIIQVVAGYFNLMKSDLQSKTRRHDISWPRQIAMYFIRKKTGICLAEIGRIFRKDHSTVIYAINQVGNMRDTNKKIRYELENLEKLIDQAI